MWQDRETGPQAADIGFSNKEDLWGTWRRTFQESGGDRGNTTWVEKKSGRGRKASKCVHFQEVGREWEKGGSWCCVVFTWQTLEHPKC